MIGLALVAVVLAGCTGADVPDDSKDTEETDDPTQTDEPVETDGADSDPVDETGETDAAETDETDAWPDTGDDDTALPTAELWSHTPLSGPFLQPRGLEPGTWWVTDPAEYEALLGAAAPAELAAGTHAAAIWYQGDRPWLSTWATVDVVKSWAPGTASLEITRHELDPSCTDFSVLMPVVAAALVPLPAVPVTQAGATVRTQPEVCAGGPTADQTCRLDLPCAPGDLCALLTSPWAAEGMCLPGSQLGAFPISGVTIPDGDPAGVTVDIAVSGLATVTLDTLIRLELQHPAPTELRVTLTNPATTEAVVWDGWTADGGSWTLRRAIGLPADESITGMWQLRLVDNLSGNAGRLDSGTLELLTQWD